MTLIDARGLTKLYTVESGFVSKKRTSLSAVEDVDLTIERGETLGLVGESGCGKSTVARLLLRLVEPTRGEVLYGGQNVLALSGRELRRLRRKMQIVFQDPYSSLNPRHSVGRIVGEPLRTHGLASRRESAGRVRELL